MTTEDFKIKFLGHLKSLIFFLEYQGANPFRIRAYERAFDTLSALSEADLVAQTKDGSLIELDGVGKGILAVAQSFLKSQSSKEFEEARGDLPISLLELQDLSGVGPKKIKTLYEELQIKSLGELEYACKENRLLKLKGFGQKTQQKILREIEKLKSKRGKFLLEDGFQIEDVLLRDAAKLKLELVPVGALARRMEILETLEFALLHGDVEQLPLKDLKVLSATEAEGFWKNGEKIRIHSLKKSKSVASLFQLRSSAEHFASLKRFVESSTSEEEIYAKAKLPFHPAEAREFEAKTNSKWKALRIEDLTGVFHLHTTASDGINTLDEMARAARSSGWSYMGLSDHSQTAFYAQGLKEEDLEVQWREVEKVQSALKDFRILRGVESDILKDGSLDYSQSTLNKFDFVIASIHARYGMMEMTDRLIKAIENPLTTMIGHISGRLLLARDAYNFDAKKIVDAAIANNCVIELNANPQRLDLDWRVMAEACQKGLLISINPDAHSTEGFTDVRYGIWMANKALVPKEQIINTWPLPKIEKFLESRSVK